MEKEAEANSFTQSTYVDLTDRAPPPPYSPPSVQDTSYISTPSRNAEQNASYVSTCGEKTEQINGGAASPPRDSGLPPVQPVGGTTVVVTAPVPAPRTLIINQTAPPSYLCMAIFSCLCCFCPTGVVAIYFASKVSNYVSSGDMHQASRASRLAKNLSVASMLLGLLEVIAIVLCVYFTVVNATKTAMETLKEVIDSMEETLDDVW